MLAKMTEKDRTLPGSYQITYTGGPMLTFRYAWSQGDYVRVLEALSEAFTERLGRHDETHVYRFAAASAAKEGGFELVEFPGKSGRAYKCLRHHCRQHDSPYSPLQMPEGYDTETMLEDCRNSKAEMLPCNTVACVTLKAFYGAPVWTLEELGIIKSVLREYGVLCGKMPYKTELSEPNNEYT
jgi:hypothetical protein